MWRGLLNQDERFQVFEDDGDNADHYLEDIFEMDNHIERFSLNDHDAEKWKASKVRTPVYSQEGQWARAGDSERDLHGL